VGRIILIKFVMGSGSFLGSFSCGQDHPAWLGDAFLVGDTIDPLYFWRN
jgi:hypothetical protein